MQATLWGEKIVVINEEIVCEDPALIAFIRDKLQQNNRYYTSYGQAVSFVVESLGGTIIQRDEVEHVEGRVY
jgi:hypothetical protein